jgi:hypothetical protein
MSHFHFSLWVFDQDFILSVVIMVFCLFIASFVFTKIATSQKVHRLVNGPDPDEMRHQKYSHNLLLMMREEIGRVCDGRKYGDLNKDEWELVQDIRSQYFNELKGVNNGNK